MFGVCVCVYNKLVIWQVGLGQLYLSGGRGVEQNFQQAHHYFNEASEAGSANAFAYLGKMYLDGSPATPQNNNTAYQFFKRAADKAQPKTQTQPTQYYSPMQRC